MPNKAPISPPRPSHVPLTTMTGARTSNPPVPRRMGSSIKQQCNALAKHGTFGMRYMRRSPPPPPTTTHRHRETLTSTHTDTHRHTHTLTHTHTHTYTHAYTRQQRLSNGYTYTFSFSFTFLLITLHGRVRPLAFTKHELYAFTVL